MRNRASRRGRTCRPRLVPVARYRLIVPADAWRTLEQSQRLLILRHELAHIERHDVWKSLAMRILALPHWFNPLVWHIVRRFDESTEWACDEAAAGAAPDRIPDYARACCN